jgi:hypothetical protein
MIVIEYANKAAVSGPESDIPSPSSTNCSRRKTYSRFHPFVSQHYTGQVPQPRPACSCSLRNHPTTAWVMQSNRCHTAPTSSAQPRQLYCRVAHDISHISCIQSNKLSWQRNTCQLRTQNSCRRHNRLNLSGSMLQSPASIVPCLLDSVTRNQRALLTIQRICSAFVAPVVCVAFVVLGLFGSRNCCPLVKCSIWAHYDW